MSDEPTAWVDHKFTDEEVAARMATLDSDLSARLARNARFYQREAEAMRPIGSRHLGPEEAGEIARLLSDAVTALSKESRS